MQQILTTDPEQFRPEAFRWYEKHRQLFPHVGNAFEFIDETGAHRLWIEYRLRPDDGDVVIDRYLLSDPPVCEPLP